MTAPLDIDVQGFAHGEFAPLANILARLVASERGRGASLAIYRGGKQLVDLSGGTHAPDTLQLQFSVSKAVTAIAAMRAHHEGELDLDQPIGEFWPAFARPATKRITTRMILSHGSGLAGVDVPLTIDQLLRGDYTAAIEQQEPYWEPGSTHGYHAFSWGPLMDGVFERALGRSVGSYVAETLAGPLDLELWFGCPSDRLGRVRPIDRPVVGRTPLHRSLGELRLFEDRGSRVLAQDSAVWNRPEVLTQGWPSTSVVCTARSMAKLMAATLGPVDGQRALSAAAAAELARPVFRGTDWVLRFPIAFGSGVQLPFPQLPYTGPSAYGHEGAGGCIAFADPERDLAVAFTTDAFPACDGASVASLALCSTIRMLADSDGA